MKTEFFNSITRHLREIGLNMRLLLVEDDEALQKQFQKLLLRFFGRVDVANNGLEALQKYSQRKYHLVVTDITMPIMDGIELSKHLRAINSSQNILVISAHSESQRLIELINIGIDGFLLKPIEMEKVLHILDRVCQSIYDQDMHKYYSKMLEDTNKELKEKNAELDRVLNELTIIKASHPSLNDESIFSSEDIECKMSAKEFFITYASALERTNEKLEFLEESFNLTLLQFERTPIHEIYKEFIDILSGYAQILKDTPQVEVLSHEIKELEKDLLELQNPDQLELLLPKLTLLFDNFEQWRRALFSYKNAEDIHFMDRILINDIHNIKNTLKS